MQTFRKHVLVCTNEKPGKCGEKGGLEILAEFRKQVGEKNLAREIYVSTAGCTGQHACGPTIIVYPDGVWYQKVTLPDVAEIIEAHLCGGKVVGRLYNPAVGLKKG